ncbi:MAG: hypothetical protein A3K10_14760 [Bacteroidetes bacterium RIFCSPLOWO2_12_FULL_31_6]|nr:MAG: hypothetical protein A3K10_14760 [Bacteroidetes bacterium RIFCSPLOWO2_12_FULL_31_6]
MKNLATILLFMFFTNYIQAQNLVPNPSFEQYSICPYGSYEIDKVISWSCAGGSPDYFNSCDAAGGASVPDNFYGYQNAASGNAYVGLFTYNRGVSWPENREHIQADLISLLTIGVKYYISMDISFTIDPYGEVGFAANKLGMLFTNTTSYNASNPPANNNNSQVFIDTLISDTVSWYHFESSFIADSSYQKILIGNFFDDLNTDTLNIDTSKFTAYYFIDNICVSSDSNDCLVSTSIKEIFMNNNVLLFPNPINDGYMSIEIKNNSKSINLNYHIFNSIGKMIQSNLIPIQVDKFNIDLTNLSQGIYFIKLQINSELITKKFIIN